MHYNSTTHTLENLYHSAPGTMSVLVLWGWCATLLSQHHFNIFFINIETSLQTNLPRTIGLALENVYHNY